MSDETKIYREKLHTVYEVGASDDLVQGEITKDYVRVLPGDKELARGMLLMLEGANFVPATKDGLSSAKEICILASNYGHNPIETEEGTVHLAWAFFSGTFRADRIILAYETEDDLHEELIEEIRPTLRRERIFLQ